MTLLAFVLHRYRFTEWGFDDGPTCVAPQLSFWGHWFLSGLAQIPLDILALEIGGQP